MTGFVSLFKKPLVLIGLLISLFMACLIIVVALFMGQEAGNFVIQVESGNVKKSIQITESLTSPTYSSRLEASSATNMTNTTYSRFSMLIDTYTNTEGVLIDNDKHVYSYTYYIVNNCDESLDVKATMYYSNVTKNLDKAVRVMSISSYEDLRRCYYVKDDVEMDYGSNYPLTYEFLGNGVAYEEDFLAFSPKEVIKYTVLIWLEGNDKDCTDEIRNGTIRFTMKLSIQ